MRKFRHIKTGLIATSLEIAGRVYKYDAGQAASFYILEDMLENSNDWEEIKNLLVVTYDGVKLYEGDTYYCTHGNDDTTVREVVADSSNTFYYSIKDVPVFAKKENAEKYIRDNEKKYSLNDMVNVANHWAYVKNVTPEKVLKYLENYWSQPK